jgi:hypothetical protein
LNGLRLEPGTDVAEDAPYFNEPYYAILDMWNGIRVY